MPDVLSEIIRDVGQAHCPNCGREQLFSLEVRTFSVSRTYYLVCDHCGYKTRTSRKTAKALLNEPPVSFIERYNHLFVAGVVFVAIVACALIMRLFL